MNLQEDPREFFLNCLGLSQKEALSNVGHTTKNFKQNLKEIYIK